MGYKQARGQVSQEVMRRLVVGNKSPHPNKRKQLACFANALAGMETTQLTVTRTPVAWGTGTEHLPCLSESVFVDVVM